MDFVKLPSHISESHFQNVLQNNFCPLKTEKHPSLKVACLCVAMETRPIIFRLIQQFAAI